jgi:ribosomal protein S7
MIDIYIKHSDEIGFYKGKSPNVSRLINNVLMSQKQENNIIEKVFTVLMNSVKESALKHPEQAFQQVISFLNSFFKEIEIKKMYNTIPRTPLSRYAKQNL